MPISEQLRILNTLTLEERREKLRTLSETEREEVQTHWKLWARSEQLPPPGDWRTWLIMAGRGFGKTRAGAEWARAVADADPQARIAFVGASLPEVRAVMVEGESGLLGVCPLRHRPEFEPSLRRISWPNGAQALLYSAGDPETLRGPQHSHAWCDEIAKWDNASQRATRAWDNLLFGLRLGELPRLVATTTPRAVPLVRRLMEEADDALAITRGCTEDNRANLPDRFVRDIRRQFGKSLLGRQELDGELLDDIEGALWTRALIEQRRETEAPELVRVVVGVDPPASSGGDACGIIVAGRAEDGTAHVLADASVQMASPERWARAVARTARAWRVDKVVAEANQGGAMVASVLRAADISLPLKLVHASRGKVARAEPVAALYEAGRVRHAGTFPELEDELCGLIAGGAYQGPGRSPDRADALVWALTELMLGKATEPRVRVT
ncbi:DNA-packaging protein [Novosphingobium malaysiense]|uniref:ATP-binding protein n=1 Tax=Novosphingobium malaysiense TaxID=1348853 RepID=A0A0B1ZTD2_9SPHN|nr:terminase family protein [Novosphingobium malaysiense]KHK92382.1 ATP-binding protein [Novosphingobium malaysiense]